MEKYRHSFFFLVSTQCRTILSVFNQSLWVKVGLTCDRRYINGDSLLLLLLLLGSFSKAYSKKTNRIVINRKKIFSIQAPQYFSIANTIYKFFVSNTFYWNQTTKVILDTSVVKPVWFVSQKNNARNRLQASILSH